MARRCCVLRQAEALVGALSTSGPRAHATGAREEVLNTIADCGAFRGNQEALGDSALGPVMKCLDAATPGEREAAARSIANLATGASNQAELAHAIPRLCELACGFEVADEEQGVRVMALQALQNLSLTEDFHDAIVALPHRASTTVIHALGRPIDREVTLRGLRLLVNLACNAEMVPHLVDEGALVALSHSIARHGMEDVEVLRKVLTATAYVATDRRAKGALQQSQAPLEEQLIALQDHHDEEVQAWAIKAYGLIFVTYDMFGSPSPDHLELAEGAGSDGPASLPPE